MSISVLRERLQEVLAEFGDLDVIVGEASSVRRVRFDINVEPDHEDNADVCIVQAYVTR